MSDPKYRCPIYNWFWISISPIVQQVSLGPVENEIEPFELFVSCEEGDEVWMRVVTELFEHLYFTIEVLPVTGQQAFDCETTVLALEIRR